MPEAVGRRDEGSYAILSAVTLRGTTIWTLFGVVLLGLGIPAARAEQPVSPTNSVLMDLGFSLTEIGPDKNSISFTKRGLLVPTPWGDFEATVVSTPVDRMVRVPLSPNADASQPRVQPYVTAGSRKSVDEDPALESARAVSYASELGRGASLKAGAGVLLKLDDRVELFGEYQFMRLQRDGGTGAGSLGTGLDSTGFSMGLSVRY